MVPMEPILLVLAATLAAVIALFGMAGKNRGGGDVYPQILKMSVTETAAQAFTQNTINTPVLRNTLGMAVVMELLKAWIFTSTDTLAEDGTIQIQLTSTSQTAILTDVDQRKVLSFILINQLVTSGASSVILPYELDFQDAQGKGVLYAGSNLFLAIDDTGQGTARAATIWLFYRLRAVSAQELLGIIDSFG